MPNLRRQYPPASWRHRPRSILTPVKHSSRSCRPHFDRPQVSSFIYPSFVGLTPLGCVQDHAANPDKSCALVNAFVTAGVNSDPPFREWGEGPCSCRQACAIATFIVTLVAVVTSVFLAIAFSRGWIGAGEVNPAPDQPDGFDVTAGGMANGDQPPGLTRR